MLRTPLQTWDLFSSKVVKEYSRSFNNVIGSILITVLFIGFGVFFVSLCISVKLLLLLGMYVSTFTKE